MKYSERAKVAKSLRDLADWIEQHGHRIPNDLWISGRANVYRNDPNPAGKMKNVALAMGACKKEYTDYSLTLVKDFGNAVKLKVDATRDTVCTKKIVGVKEVDNYVVVGKKTVEVVEWECDPLLS